MDGTIYDNEPCACDLWCCALFSSILISVSVRQWEYIFIIAQGQIKQVLIRQTRCLISKIRDLSNEFYIITDTLDICECNTLFRIHNVKVYCKDSNLYNTLLQSHAPLFNIWAESVLAGYVTLACSTPPTVTAGS